MASSKNFVKDEPSHRRSSADSGQGLELVISVYTAGQLSDCVLASLNVRNVDGCAPGSRVKEGCFFLFHSRGRLIL